jgi:hypothetical protein
MNPEELRTFFMSKGLHPKMSSFISSIGETKYKLGKNSLKKFKKGESGWIKIWSAYYKNISINKNGKLHIEKFI